MNYGFLDIEMTCDGKQENGKFIDDGRMKRSQREIISVGFVVCNDEYNVITNYSSFVKPVRNTVITEYCTNLTGITQSNADNGKKCNNAFRDIRKMCYKFSVNYIFTFGNADSFGIRSTVWRNKKQKEDVSNLCAVLKRIVDIEPIILKKQEFENYKKRPGLSKIADMLNVTIKGERHNALNDAFTLCEVCRKLNISLSEIRFSGNR